MPDSAHQSSWQLDLGANVVEGGTRFHVWAPNAKRVEVVLARPDAAEQRHALTPEADGYHTGTVMGARAGDRYRYSLDGGQPFPDPCSRFQPEGPHGPSEIVDPRQYHWRDDGWRGLGPDNLAIYELHVGTFTPEGTFEAAIARLRDLKALGVTAVEIMPVAEFPGRRNWGYDGVDLYAPESAYGGPEGLRRLVDAAHAAGLGVLLDVVYNHFGPDGNYLRVYAKDYFTDRHTTPWGDAVNYDGPNSAEVRHFVLQNVRYWLHEYHVDGLRLDATHAIVDTSPRHLLAEIAEAVHSVPGRPAVVIAEDHRNLVQQIRPAEQGGLGLDGVWADDFHHALRTYLTGYREGYYANYTGTLADVATTVEQGFLFQGQKRPATGELRGTKVTDEPARAFVYCSENHDQVGNRALGERLAHLIDHERYLVASAVLLFVPQTIMLFQGQEYAASSPFQYFTEHNEELGRLVTEGRRKEFASFKAFADPEQREKIPDPQAESTFQRSKLDWSERQRKPHADVLDLYRTLLNLRQTDPVLRHQDRTTTQARALTPDLLAICRWHGDAERLLLANFGEAPVTLDHSMAASLAISDGVVRWRTLYTTPGVSSVTAPADLTGLSLPPRSAILLARDRKWSMEPRTYSPEEVSDEVPTLNVEGPPGESIFRRVIVIGDMAAAVQRVAADIERDAPHFDDLTDHRVAALVGAMLVENAVHRFNAAVIPGYKALRDRREFSFSVGIELARALQLGPSRLFAAADAIRKVRNDFAHQLESKSFDDLPNAAGQRQRLRDHLRQFSDVEELDGDTLEVFRSLVMVTVTSLHLYRLMGEKMNDFIRSDALIPALQQFHAGNS